MRNTLILLILVSIGLTTPALAKNRDGERHNKSNHRQVERVQKDQRHFGKHDQRHYAKHDRQDNRYGKFQKRMKHLRKELRHERRDNRRMERRLDRRLDRRDRRHSRKVARDYGHRRHYSAPVVVEHRRSFLSMVAPSLVVRIPLNW